MNKLVEIQKTALNAIVDYHVSNVAEGTPIDQVVLQGPPSDADKLRGAALSLAPDLVDLGGIAPRYILYPTWRGLLLSSQAPAVQKVAARLLEFFKHRIETDGTDFRQYELNELLQARVISSPGELPFLHAVIKAFRLLSGGSISVGASASARWNVPGDIIDFRGFTTFQDLMKRVAALERQQERQRALLARPSPPANGNANLRRRTKKPMPKHPREVFVVHGRNRELQTAMFGFLRSLGLNPMEFDEARNHTRKTAPYIGEILNVAFSRAQAIVVLLSGDDEARLLPRYRGSHEPKYETQLTRQARPNVLFEAGMAIGRDEKRTILVEVGNGLRPLSDIQGRHVVRMTSGSASERQKIVERLRTAKCRVDTRGKSEWLDVDFFKGVFGRRKS